MVEVILTYAVIRGCRSDQPLTWVHWRWPERRVAPSYTSRMLVISHVLAGVGIEPFMERYQLFPFDQE